MWKTVRTLSRLAKKPPEAPNTEECCSSACSDCVYLKYAEALVDFYKDGGEKALEEVDKIPDYSVKAFVKTELKIFLASEASNEKPTDEKL